MAKNNKKLGYAAVFCWAFAVAIIVTFLVSGMRGKTEYTDTNPPATKTSSATCTNSISVYPVFLSLKSPDSGNTRVNIIFNDRTISMELEYTAIYSNAETAHSVYNHMGVTFGEALAKVGLKSNDDTFSEHITEKDNQILFSLYAENIKINRKLAPFLGITSEKEFESLTKKEDVLKIYADSGFSCKSN